MDEASGVLMVMLEPYVRRGGRPRDRRPRPVEEVGGRVDLRRELAWAGVVVFVPAAGHEHRAVRHEDSGRVVVARGGDRRSQCPSLRGGIPDLGREHAGGHLGLVAGRLAADGENAAVGQHGERVVDPRLCSSARSIARWAWPR